MLQLSDPRIKGGHDGVPKNDMERARPFASLSFPVKMRIFPRGGQGNPNDDTRLRQVTEPSGNSADAVVNAIVGIEDAGDLRRLAHGDP